MLESSVDLKSSIEEEILSRLRDRRSIRRFQCIKDQSVLEDFRRRITTCILAAGTAPSGANTQPWFFSLVGSIEIKKKIREMAEVVEKDFYLKKAPPSFLDALEPLKTDWQKPHLEEASFLVVIFTRTYNEAGGVLQKCYYPHESVGIATGILISTLHLAGFDLLTHTPSPMKFLNSLLGRPNYERAFLILAVGKRHKDYQPPNLLRKRPEEILSFL